MNLGNVFDPTSKTLSDIETDPHCMHLIKYTGIFETVKIFQQVMVV